MTIIRYNTDEKYSYDYVSCCTLYNYNQALTGKELIEA